MTTLINSQFIDTQYEKKIDCSSDKFPRYMYLLPKIHKETHEWLILDKIEKGRPIISCSSAFLSIVSKFIDRNLKPLVFKKNPHFIRSSYELLQQLNYFILPFNVEFLVADISELYLNIDVNLVSSKVFDIFCMSNQCEKAWMLEKLLKFDLTHQLFTFDGHYYRQPNGIFMGSPFSPSLAYLYLLDFDISVRNQANILKLVSAVMVLRFTKDKEIGPQIDELELKSVAKKWTPEQQHANLLRACPEDLVSELRQKRVEEPERCIQRRKQLSFPTLKGSSIATRFSKLL
ncbi:hypothetical protein RF11_07024 [Thelohanellus kitauei]|uniref:Reverse transcriptase domain-containing protein n=1 Tax=Thelohanellus kitauei TaxID=669202 RepID=A0A0C2JYZ6_THEKT|nr:hypothetical protein RF11_07024 [Thelohanellus kitauei]